MDGGLEGIVCVFLTALLSFSSFHFMYFSLFSSFSLDEGDQTAIHCKVLDSGNRA